MARWPAGKNKLTEVTVTGYCNTRIKSGTIGKACDGVAGIDFESEVKSCIEDIKVICNNIIIINLLHNILQYIK